MGVYDRSVAATIRLIDKFGQTAIYRKQTVTPDPDEPWKKGSVVNNDIQVKMVFLPFRPDQVEGYAFERGDELGYLAAGDLPVTLDEQDQIIRSDGSLWAIVAVTKLSPGGVPILYEMQVRQWPRRSQ